MSRPVFSRSAVRPMFAVMAALAGLQLAGPLFAQAPASAPAGSGAITDADKGELKTILEEARSRKLRDNPASLATLEAMVNRWDDRPPGNLQGFSTAGWIYEQLSLEAKNAGKRDQEDQFRGLATRAYLKAGLLAGGAAAALAGSPEARQWHDMAENFYQRVLSAEPSHSQALLGLARAYRGRGEAYKAIDKYKDYLGPDGTGVSKGTLSIEEQATARLELGMTYNMVRSWRQALSVLEKANQNEPEVLATMAEAWVNLDSVDRVNIEKARAAAEQAVRLSNGQPQYWSRLAGVLLAVRDVKGALDAARQAREQSRQAFAQAPGNLRLLNSMAQTMESYVQILGAALAGLPADAEAKVLVDLRLELATALQDQSDIRLLLGRHEALNVLQDAPPAVANDPRLVEAREQLARSLGLVSRATATAPEGRPPAPAPAATAPAGPREARGQGAGGCAPVHPAAIMAACRALRSNRRNAFCGSPRTCSGGSTPSSTSSGSRGWTSSIWAWATPRIPRPSRWWPSCARRCKTRATIATAC